MKGVHFHLGPAFGLTSRQLTITRHMRAGDDSAPAAESDQTLAGTTENVVVDLPDNTIWQAVLQDTLDSGEVGDADVLSFHTGELQFPGPGTELGFRILAMEDLSSSSSSSSQSSSSSSSQSSSSSSSDSSSSQSSSSSG